MSVDVGLLLRAYGFELVPLTGRAPLPAGSEELVWEDDHGGLQLSRPADEAVRFRMRLGSDVAVDLLDDRRVAVSAGADVSKSTVDHFLADQVVPRLLAGDGKFVIHAAAVHTGKSALLFVGTTGSGKSTLSSHFHNSGWPLLGDDASVVHLSDGGVAVSAIYPSLRLFPDSIGALFPAAVETEEMAHYSDKRRLAVDIDAAGSMPVPVAGMFLLDDEEQPGVTINPVAPAEACMALIDNSFALDPTDVEEARVRLAGASRVALDVPAFRLRYPRNYAILPKVRSAVLDSVGVIRLEEKVSQ